MRDGKINTIDLFIFMEKKTLKLSNEMQIQQQQKKAKEV